MNIGLYESAASLTALERWQSAVAQNITASQVPGFKKRTVEFDAELMGQLTSRQRASGKGESQPCYYPKATYGINYQSGELSPTRRELDVALQGEGFFVIRLQNGQQAYTRNGQLSLKNDRTLAHSSGAEILGEGGSPIQALPTGGSIVVNKDGSVYQGDIQIGKLQVVSFENNARLMTTSNGAFLAGGMDPRAVEKPEVLQGYVEESNVSAMHEMVSLVTIARAYEANQKLVQARDDALSKAIEKLG